MKSTEKLYNTAAHNPVRAAFFQILLDQKIVAVALSNSFGSDDEVYFLARDLNNLLADTSAYQQSVNYLKRQLNKTLKQHVGNYQYEDKVLEITKKGNQLYMQEKPYPKVPIFPQSENKYFCRLFDAQLDFSLRNRFPNAVVEYTYKGESKTYEKIN